MNEIITDILIVGAGPSGTASAMAAHKNNLKAILIDREKFPRDKICGDGVTFASFQTLEEIGFNCENIKTNANYCVAENLIFYGENNTQISYENDIFFTLKRFLLDNILLNQLPAEVPFYEGTTIEEIQKKGEHYHVKCNSINGKINIKTNYIIGADGYSSFIRRNFFKELNFEKRVASRYYITNNNLKNNAYNFFFHENISPGYFWIFPIGKDSYNTGVYLPHSISSNELFKIHQSFIQKYFNEEIDKSNFHTWTIPNNTSFNNLAKDNILLVGDAAGFCDKLIGHGIDAAYLSALVAIKSILYHKTDSKKQYPFEEIYRYNLDLYFKDSLTLSMHTYTEIDKNINETSKHLKKYLSNVFS